MDSLLKKHMYETQNVEFKSSLAGLDTGVKSLCAFLNTRDGKGNVYFGITDKGRFIGLEGDVDSNQKNVRQKIENYIFPKIHPNIETFEYEKNRIVICVAVERVDDSVCYKYKNVVIVRVGTSNVKLSNEESYKIILSRKKYSDAEIGFLKQLYHQKKTQSFHTVYDLQKILRDGLIKKTTVGRLANSINLPMEEYEITDNGYQLCKLIYAVSP